MTAFHASAQMDSSSGGNPAFYSARATPAKALRSVTLAGPSAARFQNFFSAMQQALCDCLRGHFPIQPTEQQQ